MNDIAAIRCAGCGFGTLSQHESASTLCHRCVNGQALFMVGLSEKALEQKLNRQFHLSEEERIRRFNERHAPKTMRRYVFGPSEQISPNHRPVSLGWQSEIGDVLDKMAEIRILMGAPYNIAKKNRAHSLSRVDLASNHIKRDTNHAGMAKVDVKVPPSIANFDARSQTTLNKRLCFFVSKRPDSIEQLAALIGIASREAGKETRRSRGQSSPFDGADTARKRYWLDPFFANSLTSACKQNKITLAELIVTIEEQMQALQRVSGLAACVDVSSHVRYEHATGAAVLAHREIANFPNWSSFVYWNLNERILKPSPVGSMFLRPPTSGLVIVEPIRVRGLSTKSLDRLRCYGTPTVKMVYEIFEDEQAETNVFFSQNDHDDEGSGDFGEVGIGILSGTQIYSEEERMRKELLDLTLDTDRAGVGKQ